MLISDLHRKSKILMDQVNFSHFKYNVMSSSDATNGIDIKEPN